MFAGDTVELHGADGSVSRVNYRGPINSELACVVGENGHQYSIAKSRLKAIPKPATVFAVGEMVYLPATDEFGTVEEVQGMFYLVRVDDAVHHYHRNEVKAG
jgi:hypothetical protein